MPKSAKKRREIFENGKPGVVYGIWNALDKRFVFGIRESSPKRAYEKLRELNRKGSYCMRYEARPVPDGWVNPENPNYRKQEANHEK